MKCYHCGQEIEDHATHCAYCGAYQGAGATVVLDQIYNPYGAESETGRTDSLSNMQFYSDNGVHYDAPKIQFATNRTLLKMVLFGILTFGIYDICIWCKMITELNVAACRHDGKRTMPYLAVSMLTPITFGILPFVWHHKLCNRIGDELQRRGCDYAFSSATFWLWNVLGSLILVGPFVFTHKLLHAMNLINGDFNMRG